MSLNWQEIDLILKELQLPGCFIQKIKQPDFRTLVLDLYRPGEAFPLIFSLADRAIRLHRTRHVPPNEKGSQRFAQLLRSHIQGGRITAAEQINSDRLVRISILHGEQDYSLFFRLWGGNANIFLTDEQNIILDAFMRRPQHEEASGSQFSIPVKFKTPDPHAFPLRNFPESSDYNDGIDKHYHEQYIKIRTEQLQRERLKQLQLQLAKMQKQRKDLEKAVHEKDRAEDYRTWGNLLLTHAHGLTISGADHVQLNDFDQNIISIKIQPDISAAQNADRYFQKAKKAEASALRTRELLQQVEDQISHIESEIRSVNEHPEILLEEIRSVKNGTKSKIPLNTPGLHFRSGDCSIIVGRTAKENDSLLRRYVKGNDWWLHTRDYPGAYVFIKPPPGKSVPLDVLLDAGNLAIWYSKAKSGRKADLFYTQAKYLKRVGGSKIGLVIPTQEKNLNVEIDDNRIKRLLDHNRQS
ncbi:NFACT RNA binding domain-containing protein [Spirochaeta dissipatitropha]